MITLSVPDMSCGHCKASVETALAPLSNDVQVDLQSRQVQLHTNAPLDTVLVALLEVGFDATVVAKPS